MTPAPSRLLVTEYWDTLQRQSICVSNADVSKLVFAKVYLSGALLDDANPQNALSQAINLEGADLRNIQYWKELEAISGSDLYGREETHAIFDRMRERASMLGQELNRA